MRAYFIPRMRPLRSGSIAILSLLLIMLSGCAVGTSSHSSLSVTQCTTRTECEQIAHKAGIRTPIAELQGNQFRFLIGFFYPKSKANPVWAFRLQFTYSPTGDTVEEDVAPFTNFTCVNIPGIESALTTVMGRSFCYLPAGSKSEARYGMNGLLYKLYLLPPTSSPNVSSIQSLLQSAVDSLH